MTAPMGLVLLLGPVIFVSSASIFHLLSSSNVLRIASHNPSEKLDLSSIRNLCFVCWNVLGLGLILLFAYVCEADILLRTSDDKHYDRDQFLFLLILILAVCMACWRPPPSDAPRRSLLNRNQTDEWKGWMQITILLYHYSGCDEYQPLIQTLIAVYVWITAFGHTSSFLRGRDTWLLQYVLWRLGFLAVLLSLTLHSVQLYGAVILHGCCFSIVYMTMLVMHQVSSTQWGLRTKVAVLSLVLLVFCWDSSSRPMSPRALSSLGVGGMGDWFRQAHLYLVWPTLLGMAFALNIPVVELFFQKLEDDAPFLHVGGKLTIGSALVSACFSFAMKLVSGTNSVEDNSFSYFAVAFLLTCIFLRNMTLWVRGHSNPILASLGKITLELHLLHHHIWLTAGSSRVLVLVAGYPKVNFLLCSGVFVLASRHAHHTTRLLRDAVWNQPSIRGAAFLLYCVASMGVAGWAGGLLRLPVVFLWSVILGYIALHRILLSYAPSDRTGPHQRIAVGGVFGVIMMCILLSFVLPPHDQMPRTAASPLSAECEASVLQGDWVHVNTCDETILGYSRRQDDMASLGTCGSLAWGWAHSEETCQFTSRRPKQLLRHLNGRNVTFVGDSIVRHLYHASCRLLGDSRAGAYNTSAEKHSDYSRVYANARIEFRWAPYVANISAVLNNVIRHAQGPDLLVMGGGAWDRLHMYGTRDEQAKLSKSVTTLKEQMQDAVKSVVPIVWVSPTAMNSWALNTEEKRQNIREDQMVQFRDLFGKLGIYDAATFVLHGTSFTSSRVDESYDGVHYPFPIYDGGAQLLANAYDWLLEAPPRNIVGQVNDEKRNSTLLVLSMMCIIGTALFLMDSFIGLSYIVAWMKPSLQPRKLYEECTPWLDQQGEERKLTKCSDQDEDEMNQLNDNAALT